MLNGIPFEFVSNFLSVIVLIVLGYRYLQYSKKVDVIKQLDEAKTENALTAEDIAYITDNEAEYAQSVIKTEANIKVSNPAFILVTGILFISFPWQEAMIHLNVVVVTFLFVRIDRIHKKNLYKFLYDLKARI